MTNGRLDRLAKLIDTGIATNSLLLKENTELRKELNGLRKLLVIGNPSDGKLTRVLVDPRLVYWNQWMQFTMGVAVGVGLSVITLVIILAVN